MLYAYTTFRMNIRLFSKKEFSIYSLPKQIPFSEVSVFNKDWVYSGADKYLARPGRKQATATEDFDFHISYL